MSDELNKKNLSVFEIFDKTKITFEEAEEQAKALAGKPKVDRFRMGDDGTYSVRVFPLAPNFDKDGNILPMERHGFDYAVHQQFISIELPKKSKDKKAKTISIPVVCATDKEVGKSIDLIDEYVKIATEMYGDDEELMELVNNTNYYGGLKWSYLHAMYVLDLTEKGKRKGPMLWQCSHSQYMQLYESKQRLWVEEREDDEKRDCPVSGFKNAYPVSITRKTDKKTEYTIEMGRKKDDLTEDELNALLDLPRIPEQIYRFSLYSLEAEVLFLQQYDEKHGMEVTKEKDFKEAIERLKAELPADDTRHFDISKAGEDKGGGKEEVTVNSLWAELDAIEDAGLSEKSDEYQDLREKIRQFVEDNELDIRLTRSKSNQKLIEEIEDIMDGRNVSKKPEKEDEPEENDAPDEQEASKKDDDPRQRRSRRNDDDEEPDEKSDDKKDDKADDEQPRRTRRARPGSAADAEESKKDDEPDDETSADEKPEERSGGEDDDRSRLHTRRRR